MFNFTFHQKNPFKTALVALAALALCIPTLTPRQARAGDAGGIIAGGIIGLAIICAANPKACGGRGRGGGGGGGGGGPADAVALNQTQKMEIQRGLQNLGFYTSTIDGAFGAGTRDSIRKYQTAVGATVNGVMTGVQINDLTALSPSYAGLAPDSPTLFATDIARDVTRDQLRDIQSSLNARGYAAGTVDGAMGAKTRNAVAAYKSANGLPGGPVPSRRLLAHLQGTPAPRPLGAHLASVRFEAPRVAAAVTPTPMVKPQGDTPSVTPKAITHVAVPALPPVAAEEVQFDILGARLGMAPDELRSVLAVELGSDLVHVPATGAEVGGNAVLDTVQLTTQSAWPADVSEQIISLSAGTRPEAGALAVFRLILMPDTVTEDVFKEHVLPELVLAFGEAGRIGGTMVWVGDPDARKALSEGTMKLADCGTPRFARVDRSTPGAEMPGGPDQGPVLDSASLTTIRAACGEVVSASYEDNVIRVGLWDATALSQAMDGGKPGGVVPKIRF